MENYLHFHNILQHKVVHYMQWHLARGTEKARRRSRQHNKFLQNPRFNTNRNHLGLDLPQLLHATDSWDASTVVVQKRTSRKSFKHTWQITMIAL
jgi:hypothetical protein